MPTIAFQGCCRTQCLKPSRALLLPDSVFPDQVASNISTRAFTCLKSVKHNGGIVHSFDMGAYVSRGCSPCLPSGPTFAGRRVEQSAYQGGNFERSDNWFPKQCHAEHTSNTSNLQAVARPTKCCHRAVADPVHVVICNCHTTSVTPEKNTIPIHTCYLVPIQCNVFSTFDCHCARPLQGPVRWHTSSASIMAVSAAMHACSTRFSSSRHCNTRQSPSLGSQWASAAVVPMYVNAASRNVRPVIVILRTGLSMVPEILNNTFVCTRESFSAPVGRSVPLKVKYKRFAVPL